MRLGRFTIVFAYQLYSLCSNGTCLSRFSIFSQWRVSLVLAFVLGFDSLFVIFQQILYIQSMSRLAQLRDFMVREQTKTDPFWRSVLQSDTRNIFPKHELSKIQIAKNKMGKMRLIMEQLPHFLSLQLYAKNIELVAKNTQEKDIKKELDQLTRDFQICRTDRAASDYQFEVIEGKGKVEYFCGELAKPRIKEDIREVINRCPKWKQYLQTYTKQPSKIDQLLKEKDKCDLAMVVDLAKVDDSLCTGTSGKIIEERIKQQVFMDRLRQILENDNFQFNLEVPNDPWKQQWQQIVAKLRQPACYV